MYMREHQSNIPDDRNAVHDFSCFLAFWNFLSLSLLFGFDRIFLLTWGLAWMELAEPGSDDMAYLGSIPCPLGFGLGWKTCESGFGSDRCVCIRSYFLLEFRIRSHLAKPRQAMPPCHDTRLLIEDRKKDRKEIYTYPAEDPGSIAGGSCFSS